MSLMSRFSFPFIPAGIAVFLSGLPTAFGAGADGGGGVQLLQSSGSGVTLRVEPQGWQFDELSIRGVKYARVTFSGATVEGSPGAPMIPVIVAVIGIPPDAEAIPQVVQSEFMDLEEVRLAPHPYLKKTDGLPTEVYEPDPTAYSVPGFIPESVVEVGAPERLRGLQIVRVKVRPVQFAPQRHLLRQYRSITITLTFGGGRGEAAPVTVTPAEREIYEGAVLNGQQALRWIQGGSLPSLQKGESPFAQGEWYKISVRQEGIYKLEASFLSAKGIDISTIDPRTIRIYNNGGRTLPRQLSVSRPDSLIENAILVVGEEDGRLDRSDYILFYARGVEGWEYNPGTGTYSHYINPYTFDNIYWLTWGDSRRGKRMTDAPSQSGAGLEPVTKFQERLFIEEELANPLASGIDWYGRQFQATPDASEKSYSFDLPGAVPTDTARVRIRFVGVSYTDHRFEVSLNGEPLGARSWQGSTDLGDYLRLTPAEFSAAKAGVVRDGPNSLRLKYAPSASTGLAHVDWIEITYNRRFEAQRGSLIFTGPLTPGHIKYSISNLSGSGAAVFDITDFANVQRITGAEVEGDKVIFTNSSDGTLPRRYLALVPSAYKSVLSLERDTPSDLRNPAHRADFIVITHPDFYDEVLPLKSLRENGMPLEERLETEVVLINDIYDEFSWGLVDPVAIRDFLRYAYTRWAKRPTHVLLFGDGDYDYRNILYKTDKNWIPPFETTDQSMPGEPATLGALDSRTMDEWFTRVSGSDNVPDLAIGRIPVRSPDEARKVVEKIIAYETSPVTGEWRNVVTLVGDDEITDRTNWETMHIEQTEWVNSTSIPASFERRKIYLTEYPSVQSASTGLPRKPEAQRDILEQVNRGTLIVNYIGHGNPQVWAHERVLVQSEDVQRIQSGMRLPFWVAATCDWALWDDPGRQSMPEDLMVLKKNGAIGVMSAARLVFSGENARLNQIFYTKLFAKPGQTRRLGEALWFTKLQSGSTINDEKFHILGDPTLRLAVPRHQATITAMEPDSIRALSRVRVTGQIQRDGQLWSGYQGKVLLRAFDSQKKITYTAASGSLLRYDLPGNAIFRGVATVKNGRFEVSFIVPKDITYGGNLGRVSAYFWDDAPPGLLADGVGYRDSLRVGGTTTDLVDTEGPKIKIGFKGQEDFPDGGFVEANPTLVVQIADSGSGINITGEIGHGITLVLDGNTANKVDLTRYFNYDQDSYLRGTLEFPLGDLSEGLHRAQIKAWDNSNNSSMGSVEFTVVSREKMVVRDVLNYPNPFRDETTFTFWINHDAEVSIKIYTLAGRLVRSIDHVPASLGFNLIPWDGRDQDGSPLANGVYLYKVVAKSQSVSGEALSKLVVMR